jgi:hypothetical protein
LYSGDTLVEMKGIEGEWINDDGETWNFIKGDSMSYFLMHTDNDGNKALMLVHFVRLGNEFFVDFFPEVEPIISLPDTTLEAALKKQEELNDKHSIFKNSLWTYHLVPFHTFGKIILSEETATIKFFDPSFFEKKVEANQVQIKHEKDDRGTFLITAPTPEVQKLVLQFSRSEDAYTEDIILNKS